MAQRKSPGQTKPDEPRDTRTEDVDSEAADIAQKGKFSDYLQSLTPAQCDQREVWIYRKDAASTKLRRLEICELPKNEHGCADLENYIEKKYGGGDFDVYLKLKGPGLRPNEHHGWVYLEGPPKFKGEASAPPTLGPNGQPVAQVTVQAPAAVNPMDGVTQTLEAMEKIRKTFTPENPDPLKSVDSALTVISNIQSRMAGSGQPAAAAPVDPLQQISNILDIGEKLRQRLAPAGGDGETAIARAVLGNGVSLTDAAALMKSDPEIARELLLGRELPPSVLSQVISGIGAFATKAMIEKPSLPADFLSGLVNLFNAAAAKLGGASVPANVQAQLPASTLGEAPINIPPAQQHQRASAAASDAPASEAAAASVTAVEGVPVPPQLVIDDVLRVIRRCFEEGNSGGEVAISLKCIYPRLVYDSEPHQTPTLFDLFESFHDSDIENILRSQAIMLPVLDKPEWKAFYVELKETVLGMFGGDEDENGDDEEQADGQIIAPAQAAPAGQAV
jgi:hypothetical protein